MARKLPDLLVYANPWHGPLDHNHRANTAYPWDPKDNPGRGFVGARHRLDEDGELYFEFDQYEPTHAKLAVIAAARKSESAATLTRAKDSAEAAFARAKDEAEHLGHDEERTAHLAQAETDRAAAIAAAEQVHADTCAKCGEPPAEPDELVLRASHAPVRIPNTRHYLKGVQSGALLPADLATHVTAFGNATHFQKPQDAAANHARWRAEAHRAKHLEDPDPKPRPAVGAGRLGESHAHRPLSAVVYVPELASVKSTAEASKVVTQVLNQTIAKLQESGASALARATDEQHAKREVPQ